MNNTSTLTGIVMCGGKSLRMGSDKGLLIKDNQTWASISLAKLKNLSIPVKISINKSQLESYLNAIPQGDFIMDSIEIPGPLAGLLSAAHLENTDLLVLACDMTDIQMGTIQQLITAYTNHKKEYDFFVFKNKEDLEPLLGIYSYEGLQKIQTLYNEGSLKKFSMKHILEISKTFVIEITSEQEGEFRNYNTL